MRYGFAIDTKRCIGCHTCAVACRYENNLPKEVWWNRIITEDGEYMDVPLVSFQIRAFPICPSPASIAKIQLA